MKALASILCLFSVVANAAFGFSGGYLFCKHDSGDEHLVSRAAHLQEAQSECFHASSSSEFGHGTELADCNSCTDTEVEMNTSLDDATQSQERSVVKAPSVTEFVLFECFDLPSLSCRIAEALPARAPPTVFTATVQYTATVQFRI
jgi:hypothetical protein